MTFQLVMALTADNRASYVLAMTRSRTERRASARVNAKLARDRERLWLLEPGGSPRSPIRLDSASLVEVRARSMPCPICGGETRLSDHTAETRDGVALRLAHTLCPSCGHERVIYFTLGPVLPN